ncbi:hypothetical protein [Streptomyces sp. NPDC046821]|uniref:MmyB family transcriptional regulator n=1 Tax=Streptomyces sp. NPDC046821 TaxID=3154702 RepID=UPI0034090326
MPLPEMPHGDLDTGGKFQPFLDSLLPNPAFLSNLWWDILAHNHPLENWFPWLPDERNLMRFVFLPPEAREYLVNWHTDWAAPSLAQLRFALATHCDPQGLIQLIDEILQGSEEARQLWAMNEARVHSDGDVRRLRLPAHPDEEIQIRIMSFAPLSNWDLRAIVLVRLSP